MANGCRFFPRCGFSSDSWGLNSVTEMFISAVNGHFQEIKQELLATPNGLAEPGGAECVDIGVDFRETVAKDRYPFPAWKI